MAKAILTQARLKELLHYDPDTGVFTWAIDKSSKARKGQVAGRKRPNKVGYLEVGIDYKLISVHILAVLYMTGEWPDDKVDHKDEDKLNNRWSNLRTVSNRANMQNRTRHQSNSTTGVLGVTWDKPRGKYRAQIKLPNGKHKNLGRFDSLEMARQAYLAAKTIHHEGYIA